MTNQTMFIIKVATSVIPAGSGFTRGAPIFC